MSNILKIVRIDDYAITPKYLQLINSILQGIQSGQIKKNEPLPSINEFSCTLETARSTIERAYNELKRMGLVKSVAGKGFFITHTCFHRPIKVLLLFNKLSIQKKIIYDSFADTLGSEAAIDFYIYNNNYKSFKSLLLEKADQYAKCVIIPHFNEDRELGYQLIDTLPKEKLILMDKLAEGVTGNFGAVYEDFEKDIFSALEQMKDRLSKYHTIKIIFPQHTYYSKKILLGFLRFCNQYSFKHAILNCLHQEEIETGSVYINLAEDDLVILVEKIVNRNLKPGRDVGVISYNETPVKKVIMDGITTISTDFGLMGEKAAGLVLTNSVERSAIPFKVTLRNSI
jgi:DNA-binding transcriptional regulator YhcF (GntR family)